MDKRHPRTIDNTVISRSMTRTTLLVAVGLVTAGCAVNLNAGVSTTLSTAPPMTHITTTITEIDSGYRELGAWWHIPHSHIVVRGTLEGPEDRYELTGATREVWRLEPIDILLGEAPDGIIKVSHFDTETLPPGMAEHQESWEPGMEGIFFLAPAFPGQAIPDLYVAYLGSEGVILENLDYWSGRIAEASETLGTLSLTRPVEVTPFVLATQVRSVIEGVVDAIGDQQEAQGWPYVEVELSEVTTVWSHHAAYPDLGGDELSGDVTVILTAEAADELAIGSTVRVGVQGMHLPTPQQVGFVVFGGRSGILDAGTPPEQVRNDFDQLWSQMDERIGALREHALAALRPLAEAYGRIPLVSDDHNQEVAEGDPEANEPDLTPLFRSPLVIQKESLTITFTPWPATFVDGTGIVEVRASDGTLVVAGPFEGDDSIMTSTDDGVLELRDPNGQVVAVVEPDEMLQAKQAARENYLKSIGR